MSERIFIRFGSNNEVTVDRQAIARVSNRLDLRANNTESVKLKWDVDEESVKQFVSSVERSLLDITPLNAIDFLILASDLEIDHYLAEATRFIGAQGGNLPIKALIRLPDCGNEVLEQRLKSILCDGLVKYIDEGLLMALPLDTILGIFYFPDNVDDATYRKFLAFAVEMLRQHRKHASTLFKTLNCYRLNRDEINELKNLPGMDCKYLKLERFHPMPPCDDRPRACSVFGSVIRLLMVAALISLQIITIGLCIELGNQLRGVKEFMQQSTNITDRRDDGPKAQGRFIPAKCEQPRQNETPGRTIGEWLCQKIRSAFGPVKRKPVLMLG